MMTIQQIKRLRNEYIKRANEGLPSLAPMRNAKRIRNPNARRIAEHANAIVACVLDDVLGERGEANKELCI